MAGLASRPPTSSRRSNRRSPRGWSPKTATLTVARFLDTWINDHVTGKVSPKTLKSYAEMVRLHLKPSLGHLQLAKLKQHQVQRMLRDKEEAGLSPRTVNYIRAILRIALNDAMRWDYVSRNVAALVKPRAEERKDRRYLSADEERQLLLAVEGDPLEHLYLIALRLGMRQGELLGLKWDDIDFDRSELRIRRTVVRTPIIRDAAGNQVGGGVQFAPPKTNRSRRTIPLILEVRRALEKQRDKVYGELGVKHMAGSQWQEHDLVFPSSNGTPIDASNLTQRFHRICEATGITGMTFYGLRHTAASRMATSNIPPRVAMELLGHSQIATTMEVYSHVSTEEMRRAVNGHETPEPVPIRAAEGL